MSSDERRTPTRRIPIRRSTNFRAAFIDNGMVQIRSDGLGATVSLTFLRRDRTWNAFHRSEETEPGPMGDIYSVHGEDCVSEEFEAILEPHNAYRLLVQLHQALSDLPAVQRARYGLPRDLGATAPSDDDA